MGHPALVKAEGRLRHLLYAGPVLLLAFALRAFRLDGQSLWYDEGNSAALATRSISQIVSGAAADIHPPLYYILLSWWSQIGGASEFSLRFLSVVFGLLLVAVIYKLGQKLFLSQAGLAAAGIAAVSPFLVYYSQEARMYAQGAFLCALAGLFFVKALEKDRYWPAYTLTATAALYTQYYALGVILAFNVFFVLALMWRSERSLWLRWLVANLMVAALYLPWLPALLSQAAMWPRSGLPLTMGYDPVATVIFLAPLLILGPSPFGDPVAFILNYFNLALVTAVLAVFAIAWPALGRGLNKGQSDGVRPWSGYWLIFCVPVVSWLVLLAPFWRPDLDVFNPKFLIFALPWFYIWIGLGTVSLTCAGRRLFQMLLLPFNRRRRTILQIPWFIPIILPTSLALFFLVQGAAVAFQRYYTGNASFQYNRGDHRSLASYIETQGQQGDAIILNAPGQTEIFGYYYQGQTPILPMPRQRPLDQDATGQELESLVSTYGRIWLVLWGQRESDPRDFIERWLDGRVYKTADRWFRGVRLVLYAVPRTGQEHRLLLEAEVEGLARLAAVGVPGVSEATGDVLVKAPAGSLLPLTLYWEALSSTPQPYKVFVHLLGPNATLWGQHDAEPAGGSRPTTGWHAGETIADKHGLLIPPGTPPGKYEVEVGLYDPNTGRRLPIYNRARQAVDDRLVFRYVEVLKQSPPPAREVLDVEKVVDARFQDIGLLGYEFFKLGTERGILDFHGGDIAHLALFWRAESAPKAVYPIRVAILNASGREEGVYTGTADSSYPPGRWDAGEVVRDVYKIPLLVQPGTYRLAAYVAGPTGSPITPTLISPALKLVDGKLLLAEFQVK
ncbi:MAG: glycosyltransferase family 39 protein [Dehalococcoidia bacterium]|nr:glycosyltransferase family 39 protein [Dehalococcoidia bacterium]